MDKELRILILEDVPADAELEEHELRKAGLVFTSKIVDTREAFLKALDEFFPDLILSDYELPSFDGIAALRIAKEKCPDVPVILVTGKLGEEFAIEKLKEGATDYVLKGNLKRLVPSVKRALEEAKLITERKRTEEALRESEEKYKILTERSLTGIFIHQDGRFVFVNKNFAEIHGYKPDELIGEDHLKLIHPDERGTLKEIASKRLKGETVPQRYEIQRVRKDGKTIWCGMMVTLIQYKGRPAVMGNVIDITELKQAEEAFRKELEFNQNILNTAQVIILVLDVNGYIVRFNPYMEEISGYRLDEVKGKEWFSTFLPKREQDKIRELFHKSISNIKTKGNINPIITKDGREIDIEWYNTTTKDEYGQVIGVLAIGQVITERKRLEEILKKEQRELKLIIDSSPIIVFYKDKEGKFIRVNKAFAEVLKMPEEEFVGKTVFDLYSEKIAQGMTDDDQEVFKSGHPKRNIIEQYESASDIRWVQTDKIPICDNNGNPFGLIGFAQDITERKNMEEALRESEERWKSLGENSPDHIMLLDLDGMILFINWTVPDLTKEEVIGTNYLKYVPPEYHQIMIDSSKRVVTSGKSDMYTVTYNTKDGEVRFFDVRIGPVFKNEQVVALISSSTDITERKQTQEALLESEEKYRLLFEGESDAILVFDGQSRTIIDVNAAAQKLYGYSREELLNMQLKDVAAEPEESEKTFQIALTGQLLKVPLKYHRKKDGTVFPVEISAGTFSLRGQTIVIGAIRDITERKKAEEALKKAYDEILMRQDTILNLSEDLRREIEERKAAQEKIEQYYAQVRNLVSQMALIEENERRRIANMLHDSIGQNLALSRIMLDELQAPDPSVPRSLSLDEITKIIDEAINYTRDLTFEISSPILYELGIEAAIEWLGEKLLKRRNILFEFRNDRTPKPLTKEAQVLLYQAVREFYLNIIKHSKAHHVRVFIQELGSNMHVSIEDDGIGFDTKTLHSQVSGILTYGLFSVRERISLIGGSFEIESIPGQGTHVTLIAPLAV